MYAAITNFWRRSEKNNRKNSKLLSFFRMSAVNDWITWLDVYVFFLPIYVYTKKKNLYISFRYIMTIDRLVRFSQFQHSQYFNSHESNCEVNFKFRSYSLWWLEKHAPRRLKPTKRNNDEANEPTVEIIQWNHFAGLTLSIFLVFFLFVDFFTGLNILPSFLAMMKLHCNHLLIWFQKAVFPFFSCGEFRLKH